MDNRPSQPLVSVLIRTFDRPDGLSRAVASIDHQTYGAIELVIVNDGGAELDTLPSLSQPDQRSIKLINLPENRGRSHAANQALEQASGQYVQFLDDDDWLAPDHIAKLVEGFEQHPTHVALYSDVACVRSPETIDQPIQIFANEFSHNRLSAENYLPIHAVLFERQVIDQGCRFEEQLNVFEDWNFWLQVANLGPIRRLPGVTAYYTSEYSGIGFSTDSEHSHLEHNARFFKLSVPYFNDQQIANLQYAYRELGRLVEHNQKLSDQLQQAQQANQQLLDQHAAVETKLDSVLEQQASLSQSSKTRFEQQHTDNQALLDRLAELQSTVMSSSNSLHDKLNTQHGRIDSRLNQFTVAIERNLTKKLVKKSRTLLGLVARGDWEGIVERLQRHKNRFFPRSQPSLLTGASTAPESDGNSSKQALDIMTPKHTLFVAKLLQKYLHEFGIEDVNIIDANSTDFRDCLHIVIAPQVCAALPGQYIAYQMEQSVSSRWFNNDYFDMLEHAFAVLDYSLKNIDFIQQQSTIAYKQLYYLPVSNLSVDEVSSSAIPSSTEEKEYDVVFYGDINNERRRAFLDRIGERFRVLILSEVFGEELYQGLARAKVVINIHYYENALLETTRIYEALSLGLEVVSEVSSDMEEHAALETLVDFTPIGDIDRMIEAIDARLKAGSQTAKVVPEDMANFKFYLGRMLIGSGLLDPEIAQSIVIPLSDDDLKTGVGLSLPETCQRNQEFCQSFPGRPVFHGFRHQESWKGCGLSYKHIASRAIQLQLSHVDIWEDDVQLDQRALARWEKAKALFHELEKTDTPCDLISGLLSDLSESTQILDVFEHQGERYAVIDRMISAVCNYYGPYPLQLMAHWTPHNNDIENNTMDRYLENANFRVLVPLPFVAGHKPEQTSTLWNFENSTYDQMIHNSETRLLRDAQEFLDLQASQPARQTG